MALLMWSEVQGFRLGKKRNRQNGPIPSSCLHFFQVCLERLEQLCFLFLFLFSSRGFLFENV